MGGLKPAGLELAAVGFLTAVVLGGCASPSTLPAAANEATPAPTPALPGAPATPPSQLAPPPGEADPDLTDPSPDAGGSLSVSIQAHQGGGLLGPPNSARQFRSIAKSDVYMVELDTQITRDGVIVINHSDQIMDAPGRECTHDGLRIHTVNYSRVKTIRCAGEPLPKLSEVLAIFKNTEIRLNVEIKAWDNHGTQSKRSLRSDTKKIISELDDAGYNGRYIVSFFDWRFLIETVRDIHPDLYVIALERSSKMKQPTTQMYQSVRDAAAAGANSFEPDLSVTQENLLEFIRACGMDPQIWYANTPADVRFALAHGINPISSDDPVMARKVIDTVGGAQLTPHSQRHDLRPRLVLDKRLRSGGHATARVIGSPGLIPLSGQEKLASASLEVTVSAAGQGSLVLLPLNGDRRLATTVQLPEGRQTFHLSVAPGDLGKIEVRATAAVKVSIRLVGYESARYRVAK